MRSSICRYCCSPPPTRARVNRWIVVPMVMVTLTLAGVWYGWLRLWSGSIWPVSLSHSAFNNVMESRRRRGDRDLPSDDGLRDHRDRGSDHDHHGAGRGLPADPLGRRLRKAKPKYLLPTLNQSRLRGQVESLTGNSGHRGARWHGCVIHHDLPRAEALGGSQANPMSNGGSLAPATDAELGQDIGDVHAGRLGADEQRRSDLTIGTARPPPIAGPRPRAASARDRTLLGRRSDRETSPLRQSAEPVGQQGRADAIASADAVASTSSPRSALGPPPDAGPAEARRTDANAPVPAAVPSSSRRGPPGRCRVFQLGLDHRHPERSNVHRLSLMIKEIPGSR